MWDKYKHSDAFYTLMCLISLDFDLVDGGFVMKHFPDFLRYRGLPAEDGGSCSEGETEKVQQGGEAAGAAGGQVPAVPHSQLGGRRK